MKLGDVIRVFLSLVLLLIIIPQSHGGAWTKKKNEGYSQLSYTYIQSNSLFKEDGSTINLRRDVGDYTLQGYLEYGLTDKLTLVTILPYKFVSTGTEIFDTEQFADTLNSSSLTGFSNIVVAGKYNLISKKYVLSAQLRVDANTFVTEQATGLRTGYNSWSFNPSLLLGRGWSKTYFSLELGPRFRTNDYSNLFQGNIEFGFKFKQKVWIVAVIDVLSSFEDGNFVDGNGLHTGLYVNDQESLTYGGKMLYPLNEHWGLNFSAYGAFSGNQVAHFAALTAGISYEWGK